MKIKAILITGMCLATIAGLTACGVSENQTETDDSSIVGGSKVISIQGKVSSSVTDINLCQVYLYGSHVTKFADAFDKNHADFKTLDVPITGEAPVSTSILSATGNYTFNNIDTGNYQLVLNCLSGQDIQDQSQLSDDPIQYNGYIIPNPTGIIPNISIVTVKKNQVVTVNFIDSRSKVLADTKSAVMIKADITDKASQQADLHDIWGTINRIAPRHGVEAINGLKINVVRMLGGVMKKNSDGEKIPDLTYDTATYNAKTQQYEYNFEPLTNRIDAILNTNDNLHQIVLDQPPWAFQTGYTFIEGDKFDGKHFLEKQRISHYGNSLPPKDKVAYNKFLQATMKHLVAKYGKEQVLSWRFRIGTEIETPDHWYGTEQEFVEHFANSVNAIRTVLPNAIIGLHTRTPSFLYRNGTVTNYKGEKIKSFANALIEYSHDNNIKYDFWGISDYPFINNASTRDPKTKYEHFFKPLADHPKWQQGTILDLEEYKVITHMGFIPPHHAFISADSPQADAFNIALTDEFYQHNIDQVFQWGLRDGDKPWPIKAFASMLGKPRFKTNINNVNEGRVENVGAIVVADLIDNSLQAITYHYDPKYMEAVNDREVNLSFSTSKPVGATFSYRTKLAAPEHHAFNTFMSNSESDSWLKSGEAFSKLGSPHVVLNNTGKEKWKRYKHSNPSTWTQWKKATTVARSDGKPGSDVNIKSILPLFSFEKTEIKWVEK